MEATAAILPVTYAKFADMMEPGDNIYLGRYLVSGADTASVYLSVGGEGRGGGGEGGGVWGWGWGSVAASCEKVGGGLTLPPLEGCEWGRGEGALGFGSGCEAREGH